MKSLISCFSLSSLYLPVYVKELEWNKPPSLFRTFFYFIHVRIYIFFSFSHSKFLLSDPDSLGKKIPIYSNTYLSDLIKSPPKCEFFSGFWSSSSYIPFSFSFQCHLLRQAHYRHRFAQRQIGQLFLVSKPESSRILRRFSPHGLGEIAAVEIGRVCSAILLQGG